MYSASPAGPEVFTVDEIARAAGVTASDVHALIEADEVAPAGTHFLPFDDAARLVSNLRRAAAGRIQRRPMFAPPAESFRGGRGPLAASGALHAGALGVMVLVAGLGVRTEPTEQQEHPRLVFLATPGPGGGGGGGGLRQPAPPTKAEIRGAGKLRSPVTVARKAERPEPESRVEAPPPDLAPPAPEPLPTPAPRAERTLPIDAPVVSAPSEASDTAGVLTDTAAAAPSSGPGSGGGIGTRQGTGIGEGNGAGIGDGTTAGVGGGPYRPGSGITPPLLQQEVKPVYTEEGRHRNVEGDVVMEVVVRADGAVGMVRVLRGLGSGLDQRAADAVRQWRFSPAKRFGTPVDVLVEVAVEFRLR